MNPVLPGYSIRGLAGIGSCGAVYEAYSAAGEHVAIKEFPIGEAAAQQFYRELSIVFSLRHPHIVRCLNLLYGRASRNYLIFEFVGGGTFRDALVQREKLTVEETLRFARHVALGLEEAQRQQIVHADLKPENILLHQPDPAAPDRSETIYKIADLGLSRFISDILRPEASSGSPAYMAPEQFYDRIDFTTDHYALGVMLFEALTGDRPFHGAPAKLLISHLREEPELALIAHEGLRSLIGDLLAKQPEQRPATAAEIVERIDHLLAPGLLRLATSPVHLPNRAAASDWIAEGAQWTGRGAETERSATGVSRLFAPAPGSHPLLWLSGARGTDALDLVSQRLTPQVLWDEVIETGVTAAGMTCVATARSIRIEGDLRQRGRTPRVFPHDAKLRAFAVDPEGGTIAFADAQRVVSMDFTGRMLWQQPLRNYLLFPRLAFATGRRLIASCGPASPQLLLFDAEGHPGPRLDLPGPAAALRCTPDGSIEAVALGLGADEDSRWLRWDPFGTLSGSRSLGRGVYAARWFEDGVLAVSRRDRELRALDWRAPDGRLLWTVPVEGALECVAWIPVARHAAVLEQRPGSGGRVLRLFPLLPTAESAEPGPVGDQAASAAA